MYVGNWSSKKGAEINVCVARASFDALIHANSTTHLYGSSFWAPTQITQYKFLWQNSRRKMQHPSQHKSSLKCASLNNVPVVTFE